MMTGFIHKGLERCFLRGTKAVIQAKHAARLQLILCAVQLAESQYGKLDILVNNAGIAIRGTIEETSEDDWDQLMAINMKGVFLGTKYAIAAMRRAGGGSIINIGGRYRACPQHLSRVRREQGRCASLHQSDGGATRQGQHPV